MPVRQSAEPMRTAIHVELEREIERLVRGVVQNRDHVAVAIVAEELVVAAQRVEVLVAHTLQSTSNRSAAPTLSSCGSWGSESPRCT